MTDGSIVTKNLIRELGFGALEERASGIDANGTTLPPDIAAANRRAGGSRDFCGVNSCASTLGTKRVSHGNMKARLLISSITLSLVACACATAPAPQAVVTPTPEPAPEPAPVAAEPEPTPEEIEAEKQAEKLKQDRAQMESEAQVELSRWTPELREASKKLSTTKYRTLKAAMTSVQAGPHRTPGNAERDPARHPLQTLEFFGLTPKKSVLEYGPGAGWYTELLAPVLASEGKLLVTTADPNGPKDSRQTFYAERLNLFLTKAPEVYGSVGSVIFDPDAPKLALAEPVDMALVIRGFHGWVNSDSAGTWLDQIHGALKPGGVLGIVQHRAAEGADPKLSSQKGYLPEAFVIEQVEAHGFKLVSKSEINANAKDTKDYEGGVWTLPPSLALGETDRQKYVDIGESDRMTLKFTSIIKK